MTNDQLSAILDGLTEAVFLIDESRQIILANRTARQLFGQGLVGSNFVRAVRHPDCVNCIDEVLRGTPSSRIVIQLPGPTPVVYQVSVAGLAPSQADAANGNVARAVISLDDISHVHEAEQMRSDFVANVSHELRSPLTALSGFIETLKTAAKHDAAARERFLVVMEQEANRMNRLIGDLLSLSKVESNARIRPTGRIDVTAIIKRVITTLSLRAEEEGRTIHLNCLGEIGPIPGDSDEITQVFHNLLENALKYSAPQTAVFVTIEPLKHVAGLRGPALSIAVRDTGPGIPQVHISRLTERFYRVDAGRSRDKGGTGLGLAIVKHIVTRHRGRLQVTSELGVGSSFTVLLPMTITTP
ncbi:MAG: PAS domain-containing protein [Alphaproteobacteria bacterium]|nr:PAS domain-containing protein [Alphaproteobacteria bacterium]